MIAHADNVVFLGVVYHPTTVSAIMAKADTTKQQYFGTDIQLTPERPQYVIETLGENFQFSGGSTAELYIAEIFDQLVEA